MMSTNFEIQALLGGYKSINQTMPFSTLRSCLYNDFNNIYIDTIKVQQAMVRYYGIICEECGKKVIACLEVQMLKGQHLERVNLALMNRAL